MVLGVCDIFARNTARNGAPGPGEAFEPGLSLLGPVGFRINRGLYRGGAWASVTGYPRNGAPGPESSE